MNIIKGYDTAAAYDGSFTRLAPGGYICEIIDAKVENAPTRNGNAEKFVVAVDIKGGDYDGYFRRQYERAKEQRGAGARWGARYEVFLTTQDGACSPYFKGLIKCVEESNAGYKWQWDEKTLRGKKVGIVFGEERYTGSDCLPHTTVRPFFARSVKTIIDGVDVPQMRDRTQGAGSSYSASYSGAPTVGSTNAPAGFTKVEDDDLPF